MDEQIRCGRDILFDKVIWRRFLHITKSSFSKSSRRTVASIFVNEDKPIIGFPSGRRALQNRRRSPTFPLSITNRSSITGVTGNAFKKLPTPVEKYKDSIRNSFNFKLTQPDKSAKAKFWIVDRLMLVRVGRWRRGKRTFHSDDDIQLSLLVSEVGE